MGFCFCSCLILSLLVFVFFFGGRVLADDTSGFDKNYAITWGNNHVSSLSNGKTIQLSMDESSGAGFGSKLSYGSGYFHFRMKLPAAKDTAGVVTAYYLTSQGDGHDELDFEFLGNRDGKPITLQTNVFANGRGNREERLHLWFDPAVDYHTYSILWNPHQIVFYVDKIPIRVYKNKSKNGVDYPSKPMRIEASLWDGGSWATDGGKAKVNWKMAPFKVYFKDFNIAGCPSSSSSSSSCSSTKLWWNKEKYWEINQYEQKSYENVRKKYLTYDYCSDKQRFGGVLPPECSQ